MWFGGPTVPCWTVLSSPADIVATHPLEARAAQGPVDLLADPRDPVGQGLKADLHLRDLVAGEADHHLRDLVVEEADHPFTSHLTVS